MNCVIILSLFLSGYGSFGLKVCKVHQETVTKPILADTLQASRVISEPGVWALVGHGDERRNDGDTFKIKFGSGRFLLHQEMAGSKGRKFCLSGMNSLRIVLPMSSLSCISFWWGCMSGNVSCDPT
ncbi:uncharacterized protein [Medicago truncatula]|uniref:uncharacterized protein n=1 Tax=Medicago truncatula TaxID=3880 RepID=UPI001967D396|nr:uncharacterized protein LOC25483176 [Medicago truncatula]